MKSEVDVSSGSGVRIFPLLDDFLIDWVGRGVRFSDSDVFPLLVLFDDSGRGVLRQLWSSLF